MNISLDRKDICEGCLSRDRTVKSEADDLLRLYKELLGIKNKMDKINVCWECGALLRKFVQFKDQIRRAHDAMLNWIEQQNGSLSKLKLSQCLRIDMTIEETDKKYDTLVKTEDTSQDNLIGNRFSENDFKFDVFTHRVIDRDCDESFENDYDSFNIDEKTIKTVDDFNESDNEPLHIKKTTKVKAKKVKKDVKRREKPSGVVNSARVAKKLQQLNVNSEHLEMVILSWEEVESERQASVASAKFTRHVHKCYQCALGFNHRCKLDEHMKKHQPSAGGAMCDVCQVYCKDQQALSSHRRRHRLRWRCRLCGGSWSRASVAADHVHRQHGAPPPVHTCSLCGHRAETLGKLRNHMRSHSGQHQCELCQKVFRDRTSLRTHLFIHRGEKEYSCPKCGKQFLFKKAMEVHLVTHESPANMYCHECDMTFKNLMSFNQHMKYNLKHIDPARLKYACKLCNKKFVKATRLEEHNMAVHLKITPIACPALGCRFACSSRAALRTHRRAAHGPAPPRRDHVCDVCGKAYTTKKSLEGHLRAHSGERPFRCGVCPAAFGYEAALYNHNRLVHLKHKVNRSTSANPEWGLAGVTDVQ